MTKNHELDCKDLFECDHTLEIPVSVGGEIVYWRCVCGKHSKHVSEITPTIQEMIPRNPTLGNLRAAPRRLEVPGEGLKDTMTHDRRAIQRIYQSYLQDYGPGYDRTTFLQYVGACLFEDKNELVTALKQATRNISGPPGPNCWSSL